MKPSLFPQFMRGGGGTGSTVFLDSTALEVSAVDATINVVVPSDNLDANVDSVDIRAATVGDGVETVEVVTENVTVDAD